MGEYEPEDSRNVTGTATTPDYRWTSKGRKPPPGVPDGAASKPVDGAPDAAPPSAAAKSAGEKPLRQSGSPD